MPTEGNSRGAEVTAWGLIFHAGAWIAKTPVALFVIFAGVLMDSVARLFLTFGSSYFRIIAIPEAAFGLIGAAMGGLGMAISPLARWMVAANSLVRNYVLLAAVIFAGLIGVACRWTYGGVIFVVPLAGAMMALGYMVSFYINAIVDSSHRATVLSFKGVASNLGYGLHQSSLRAGASGSSGRGSAQDAVARGLVLSSDMAVVRRVHFRGLLSASL